MAYGPFESGHGNMDIALTCRDCRRPSRKPRDKESTLPVIKGRGICARCYKRRKTAGLLSDFSQLPRSGGRNGGRPPKRHNYLIEDFLFVLQDVESVRADTKVGWSAETRTAAAFRLGITRASLDRALYREADRHARSPVVTNP